MAQEEETEHTAEERSSQERAVQLAKLQAAGLIDVPAALHLLRVAARNQFHLFDEEERDRGSVMYPQASMINHSNPNPSLYPYSIPIPIPIPIPTPVPVPSQALLQELVRVCRPSTEDNPGISLDFFIRGYPGISCCCCCIVT